MAISKEQIASSDSTLYTNVACDQIKRQVLNRSAKI